MSNILSNIRVVDFSHVQAGPICGALLADLGADVIKIEPKHGDMYRQPLEGAFFENFNRNKRGIVLDLKNSDDYKVAKELILSADVVIENFSVGVMDKLGLSYEKLKDENKRLIYGSVSAFGQNSIMSKRSGFDPIIQALSGQMDATGNINEPPVRTRAAMVDYCAGVMLSSGIMAALFRREKTGLGGRVDVPLMDVALYSMSPYITYYYKTGQMVPRSGSAHPTIAPNQAFKTADGYIYIAATSDKMWKQLCTILKADDLLADLKYQTPTGRSNNGSELIAVISPFIEKWKSRDLEMELLEGGVPCGVINSVADIAETEYIQSQGIKDIVNQDPDNRQEVFRVPLVIDGKTGELRRPAPLLGQHSEEIINNVQRWGNP